VCTLYLSKYIETTNLGHRELIYINIFCIVRVVPTNNLKTQFVNRFIHQSVRHVSLISFHFFLPPCDVGRCTTAHGVATGPPQLMPARAAARPPPQASASTGASLSLTDVVVAPQPSPKWLLLLRTDGVVG
jgi:hypothetical protein